MWRLENIDGTLIWLIGCQIIRRKTELAALGLEIWTDERIIEEAVGVKTEEILSQKPGLERICLENLQIHCFINFSEYIKFMFNTKCFIFNSHILFLILNNY